jgi:putative transposase
MIQIGGNEAWLWIAIELVHSTILGVFLSRHRNTLVVESFLLKSLFKTYGKHTVYSDGGRTWHPQACASLDLNHKIHTPVEKSIIERAIQYFKDRTENFDDYYPCMKSGRRCNLLHVYKWLGLFVFIHNEMISDIKFSMLRSIIGR